MRDGLSFERFLSLGMIQQLNRKYKTRE